MNAIVAHLLSTVRRRRQLLRLRELDDYLLADIGLTRTDVQRASAGRRTIEAFAGAVGR
jgi:uncharacterized protein YjiS (DUF1127 family)